MWFRKEKLDRAEKVQIVISYALRASLIVAIISAGIKENWLTLFTASAAVILTFLPSLIERNYKLNLPIELEFITTLFIYASLFLGEVHGYYTKFWWWDLVLHSTAGLTFGFLGFLIMYSLHRGKKVHTSSILIALFSFCFAVAIGSIWEIFEFAMDSSLNLAMQKSGLLDTMSDIIVNAIGALLTAIIGYLYMKGGEPPLFNRLISQFMKKNPALFSKTNRNL